MAKVTRYLGKYLTLRYDTHLNPTSRYYETIFIAFTNGERWIYFRPRESPPRSFVCDRSWLSGLLRLFISIRSIQSIIIVGPDWFILRHYSYNTNGHNNARDTVAATGRGARRNSWYRIDYLIVLWRWQTKAIFIFDWESFKVAKNTPCELHLILINNL